MLRLKYVLLLTVALLFQGTTILGATYHEEFKKDFSFRQGGKLILENTNGAVRVESWDRNEVRVVAKKKVKAGSRRKAEAFMKKVHIEVEQNGDNYLRIRTEYPKVKESFWDAIFGDDGISVNVSYELMVPKNLTMEIKTVNGSIYISEVAGEIEARTTNGAIQISAAKGRVNAKTTNGGIDVELLDFNEDENMSFKTTNGGIKVYFPDDFRGNIEAKTTNGRVVTDFPIKVKGKIGRRKLKGEINGGGGRITLYTTNGGIKILTL